MADDVLRELGLLALGTRLRRIGTRLQEQCQAVLEQAGIGLPASHLPLLEALERSGPLRVGELSSVLGLSQPAVTRQLGVLEAGDWLRTSVSSDDARVRVASLAPAGRQLVLQARRELWPAIEAAVADALGDQGEDLLSRLDALEDGLGTLPLQARAARHATRGRHAPA